MWIQFFRPRATGRIEFSARLVLSSNSGYSKKRVSFFQSVRACWQALLSMLEGTVARTFALVDDADFDRVSAFKWSATKTKTNVYAVRKVRTVAGRTTSLLLHRHIMGVTHPRIDVDHRDHNGLNCRRHNLRLCVRGENNGNTRKTRGASRYKGVSRDRNRGLWRACITIHNRSKFLGRFHEERDAALAYDIAARAAFGEFALCNFPLQE